MLELKTTENLTTSKLTEIAVFRRATHKVSKLTDLINLCKRQTSDNY